MDGFSFDLGVTVRDEVTGFEGKITGRAEYMSGCNRYCVEAPVFEGKLPSDWFDEGRLKATD